MRVTSKGQVTIPQHIRVKLDIGPATEVEFIEKKEHVYLVKKRDNQARKTRFRSLRGISKIQLSTDEILSLTRDI